MRILKVIGVFSPESWQGWGYGGDSNRIIEKGAQGPQKLYWADTHRPNLSEMKGDYDGKFLFVNDKANARVAVIDLEDFTAALTCIDSENYGSRFGEAAVFGLIKRLVCASRLDIQISATELRCSTKQLIPNPLAASDYGATFVTPNTEYVIETSQYPAPLGREDAPLDQYKDKYPSPASKLRRTRRSTTLPFACTARTKAFIFLATTARRSWPGPRQRNDHRLRQGCCAQPGSCAEERRMHGALDRRAP